MKRKAFGIISIIEAIIMIAAVCVVVFKMGAAYGTSAIIGTAAAALEGAVFMWVAGNAYDAFEDSEIDDDESNE